MPDTRKNALIPQIFVAQRVIDKMYKGALIYDDVETGEALVGLEMPNGQVLPTIYILDTIPPIEDTVRELTMFEQGDDWQGAIFQWWYENWEMYREKRRASYGNALTAKWDVPLVHLGDWHKQPGIIEPSLGDRQTARQFMREVKRDFLLMPIITLSHESIDSPAINTIVVQPETTDVAVRIDFWWLRRRNGVEMAEPVIVPNEDLPRMPPIAWLLTQRERFNQEIEWLEKDGLQVKDVVWWDVRGHPPLDICLIIYRLGSRNVFIAETSVNYPFRAPSWRVAPIMQPKAGQDLFDTLYDASTEVPEEILPSWNPKLTLLDAIKAIEAREDNAS